MKVVLFCGGQGLRLREYSDRVPKPMVPIGDRPIIWHLMKYYAHYGHTDFILCLGHQGSVIKDYFLHYDETVTNDFVLHGSPGGDRRGRKVELLSSDTDHWKITFVDTGLQANVGERLRAVRPHLAGEKKFLVNYSDNLSDVPLDKLIEQSEQTRDVATFAAVKPAQTFHTLELRGGRVRGIASVAEADLRINGGYFVLTDGIWDVLHEGDELVLDPFDRLIEQDKLGALRHDGFWAAMDTFKEKQTLDSLHKTGRAPWQVWNNGEGDDADG